MQVSSASTSAQQLLISAAKSSGRSEHVVSKDTFGASRSPDRFEKSLEAQTSAGTYSYESAKANGFTPASTQNTANIGGTEAGTGEPEVSQSVQFTQDDIDNLLKLFGTTEGDSEFMDQYDLDGDGTINLQDLNAMLAQLSQPRPEADIDPEPSFTQEDLDLLLESFGAQTGDENFSEALDLDGDGVIGLQDLNAMLASLSAQAQPETYTQSHIDQLTSAFGTGAGDDNFIAELDLNGDGTLNLADLNAMLASMSG